MKQIKKSQSQTEFTGSYKKKSVTNVHNVHILLRSHAKYLAKRVEGIPLLRNLLAYSENRF